MAWGFHFRVKENKEYVDLNNQNNKKKLLHTLLHLKSIGLQK